jgi:phosphate transport system substrate-binding protein
MLKLAAAAAFAAAVSFGAVAQAETVSLHGSTTVSGAVMMPHKADIEKAAGVTLDIVANGSGKGLGDLAEGKAQVAMISAPMDEVVAGIVKKGGSIDTAGLEEHQIGRAEVAFIVHPSNGVKSLTQQQLADIFAGKIKSWKDLGGADKPIVVVAEVKGGGRRTMVENEMLNKGDITAQLKEVPNAQQVVKIVAQLDNTIGIAGAAWVTPAVTALATDKPLAQPLILVTKGAPTPLVAGIIEAAKAAAGS